MFARHSSPGKNSRRIKHPLKADPTQGEDELAADFHGQVAAEAFCAPRNDDFNFGNGG
jgi:hypothetical protein